MRFKQKFFRWSAAICCVLSGLSVALCIGYHLTLEYYIEKMQSSETLPHPSETEEYTPEIFGDLPHPIPDEKGLPILSDTVSVFHILLIGTDARTPGDPCRSDAILLLSVNRQSRKIVACSLLRDILVTIEGHGENKLNASYSFGGAELLMDTLRHNFNLQIRRYISVDFSAFIRVIDLLGGISLPISADEARFVNRVCREMGDSLSRIPEKDGVYQLNGMQALTYARDRSSAKGDLDRTDRQRKLLQAMLDKYKGASLSEFFTLLDAVLPCVSTNISATELKSMITFLPEWMNYQTVLCSVPKGNAFSFDTVRGMSVIRLDPEVNISYLFEQIYT